MKNTSDTHLFIITTILALMASWVITELFSISSIRSLIFTHVTLGGFAFVIGGITLFSKKGSPLHKLTGKIFFISMVVSVSLTLMVSMLPNHVSPTLFHIGVLTLYFLIGGKRSIGFKNPNHRLLIDKILAYTVVSVSIVIISYSVIMDGNFHPLRTVFGSIGIVFGLLDLKLFKQPQNIKKKWLFLHLSKMLGGYTAAVTAFFVAQHILPGYFNWFAPTIIGLSYIFYWMIKLKTFKSLLIS
jgi:uncharacterized membrane protein